MPEYHLLKPLRTADGRDRKPGEKVTLTKRQAKYLLLNGTLSDVPPPAQEKKKPVKAAGKAEKE